MLRVGKEEKKKLGCVASTPKLDNKLCAHDHLQEDSLSLE